MSQYEYVDCKPYKGYDISKSYELDYRGRRIPNSARYMVSDSDEDWIGDVYKTLKEAHQFIDEYEADMTGVVGSTYIEASTNLEDHVKLELFDYLANYESLYVEGDYPALKYVERVKALAPAYTIDDVLDYAFEEGESLVAALEHFEELV